MRKFSLNSVVALKVKLYLDFSGLIHYSLSHIHEGTCTLSEEKLSSILWVVVEETKIGTFLMKRGKKEHLAFPEDSSREGTGTEEAAL